MLTGPPPKFHGTRDNLGTQPGRRLTGCANIALEVRDSKGRTDLGVKTCRQLAGCNATRCR